MIRTRAVFFVLITDCVLWCNFAHSDYVFWDQVTSETIFPACHLAIWPNSQGSSVAEYEPGPESASFCKQFADQPVFSCLVPISSLLSRDTKHHSRPQGFVFSFLLAAEATYFTSKEKSSAHHSCSNLSFQFYRKGPRRKFLRQLEPRFPGVPKAFR